MKDLSLCYQEYLMFEEHYFNRQILKNIASGINAIINTKKHFNNNI